MLGHEFPEYVDDIIKSAEENGRAGDKAVSDSEVDAILASLGLGDKKKPSSPEADGSEHSRIEQPENDAESIPVKAESEDMPEQPEQQPLVSEAGSETGEIMLAFVNAGRENVDTKEDEIPEKSQETPVLTESPADEEKTKEILMPEKPFEPEEVTKEIPVASAPEEKTPAELREAFERAAEAEADGEEKKFNEFFNDHILEEEPEDTGITALLTRFIKKRDKKTAEAAAEVSSTVMIPGITPAMTEEEADPTGEIRLHAEAQDETRQIDSELIIGSGSDADTETFDTPSAEQPAEEEQEENFEESGETPEYEIDDPADAPAVSAALKKRVKNALMATVGSGVLTVVLLCFALSAGGMFPAIIDPNRSSGLFLGVQLVLLLMVCGLCGISLKEGLSSLLKGHKPSAELLPSLAAMAAVLQLIICLAGSKNYDPMHLTLFAPAAALLLCGCAAGRYVEQKVILDGFNVLTAGCEHSAAFRLQNMELTHLLADGLVEEKPVLLISRPTALIKGYLRKSAARPRSDKRMIKPAMAVAILALVCALFTLLREKSLIHGVTVFAAVFCLSAPVCCTLFSAVCLAKQQKSGEKVGAVVPGWSAVEELEKINTIVVEAKDLFPRGSVVLQGIKTFEKERIDLAILYASGVLIESCSTLRDVFLGIIQNKTEMLYKVENLVAERGRGFSAWIDGKRIIVGSRNMMQAHGIDIPSLDYEKRYTRGTRMPVYLAVSGRLFGMFVVDYLANRQTAAALRDLQNNGVSILVRSDDFSVTGSMVERVYGLKEGSVKVLTAEEEDALAGATGYLPESEGCMLHMGSFASFVGGMRSASSACITQRSAFLVLLAGIFVGMLICLVLAFSGGLANIALPSVILYQIVWCIPALVLAISGRTQKSE